MSELVGLQTGVRKDKARPHIGFVYTKDTEDDFQSVTEQDEPPSRHPAVSNSLDPNNRQLHAELSSFVQKKSFAQNMMDIALLSANTNQLRYNMKDKTEMKAASHMNNLSVAGVFLVTLVNVFISTFNGAGVDVIPTETDGLINSSNLTQNITPPAAYFT
uniref:Uncharacterized protein n=1 Tax=Anopheles funestus TaxID=62324 RepID=A0A182S0L9_ANOFN